MGKSVNEGPNPHILAQRGEAMRDAQRNWEAAQWAARGKAAATKAGLPAEVVIDTDTGRAMIVRHGKTSIPAVPRRRGEP